MVKRRIIRVDGKCLACNNVVKNIDYKELDANDELVLKVIPKNENAYKDFPFPCEKCNNKNSVFSVVGARLDIEE